MMLKKSISKFILVFFLTATVFASNALLEKPNDKDVLELIDTWVSAWNSYDLSIVDQLFLKDKRVTYFSSEKNDLIKGFDAVRKHHEGFGFVEGGKDQPNKLWIEGMTIHVFESSASITGIWCFQRGADEPVDIQKGPMTFICVKLGTEWRIAHAHFSNFSETENTSSLGFPSK
jgi:ketosteroid isomerase-like protein